jgi:hypothetical protein
LYPEGDVGCLRDKREVGLALRDSQDGQGVDVADEEGQEVSANRKRKWTVRVDGEETTFTRDDVRRYFSGGHVTSGLRSFGPVRGDWRMVNAIAQDAKAYFGM